MLGQVLLLIMGSLDVYAAFQKRAPADSWQAGFLEVELSESSTISSYKLYHHNYLLKSMLTPPIHK